LLLRHTHTLLYIELRSEVAFWIPHLVVLVQYSNRVLSQSINNFGSVLDWGFVPTHKFVIVSLPEEVIWGALSTDQSLLLIVLP
jgi:hypothetical protein